jgi:type II secretory pathway pseudopilin PulG
MLPTNKPIASRLQAGFSLAETLIAFAVLGMVFAGLLYGYVQANRIAEWSSMSLAAQSYASQGTEQARAAHWSLTTTNDELPPTNYPPILGFMDVPAKGNLLDTKGNPIYNLTNIVTVSNYGSGSPPLRLIWTDCHWTFPLTGQMFTNTVILIRAADQ